MTDKANVQTIYLSLRKALARAVSTIVPPHDVEDIVQETYVRVCQVKQPASITHPRSFMLKTAKNLALDHIKRADHRLTVRLDLDAEDDPALASQQDDPYRRAAGEQEFAQFCESVRQLPIQCRKVFVLKKVYGYSQQDIAKQLGISQSTVEKHIALGIKRCAQFLEQKNLNTQQEATVMQANSTSSKKEATL